MISRMPIWRFSYSTATGESYLRAAKRAYADGALDDAEFLMGKVLVRLPSSKKAKRLYEKIRGRMPGPCGGFIAAETKKFALSRGRPTNAEFGVQLLSIDEDRTVTIRDIESGHSLRAKPGKYFPSGRLKLLSASYEKQKARLSGVVEVQE
jgi:hypothetical protein